MEEKNILISKNLSKISVLILDQKNNPCTNVYISNITDIDRTEGKYTDETGKISGYILSTEKNISILNYLDIENKTEPVTLEAGNRYNMQIMVNRREYYQASASATYRATGEVSQVDYSLVGGGGGGGFGHADVKETPGGGGGGLSFGVLYPKDRQTYSLFIGSGGTGGKSFNENKQNNVDSSAPKNGGNTSFNGTIAYGGSAPKYNATYYDSGNLSTFTWVETGIGQGGNGGWKYGSLDGKNGPAGFYKNKTETMAVSGGGGGSYMMGTGSRGNGGSPYGGAAAFYQSTGVLPAISGSCGGGGGAGQFTGANYGAANNIEAGGSGGSGLAGFRIYLKVSI